MTEDERQTRLEQLICERRQVVDSAARVRRVLDTLERLSQRDEMQDYEIMVWQNAVADAENKIMRLTATIPGGRGDEEPIEVYVARVRRQQDEALAELAYARKRLAGLGG